MLKMRKNREHDMRTPKAEGVDSAAERIPCQKSKPASKVVNYASRVSPYGKIYPYVLMLTKENLKKLTRDYESTEKDDENDENLDQ